MRIGPKNASTAFTVNYLTVIDEREVCKEQFIAECGWLLPLARAEFQACIVCSVILKSG